MVSAVDGLREGIREILVTRWALVACHRPHVRRFGRSGYYQFDLASTSLTAGALRAADAVLILTDHSSVDYKHVVRHAAVVVDTRHASRDLREGRDKGVRA